MQQLYADLMQQGYRMPEIDEMSLFRYMDIFVAQRKPRPRPVHYMDDPD